MQQERAQATDQRGKLEERDRARDRRAVLDGDRAVRPRDEVLVRIEQYAVVQLTHRLRRLERGDIEQVDRLQAQVFLRDRLGPQGVYCWIEPAYGARYRVGSGEHACQP